jgi:hypothetical protein
LAPEDIDRMMTNSQQALVDAEYLSDLCRSLDLIYARAKKL